MAGDLFTIVDKNLNTLNPPLGGPLGMTASTGEITGSITPDMIESGSQTGTINQVLGTVAAGKSTFDNTQVGYILGINKGDAEFFIGNTTSYINWANGVLTIVGGVSVSSLNIPDATTASSFHVDVSGNAWWGTNVATGYGTAPAKILATGAATFTNVTATGTMNATGGYIGTATALVYESTGINTGTTGHIRGGQTDYQTGVGYFLGYSGGQYKFSIGDGGVTQYLTWDGAILTMNGRSLSAGSVNLLASEAITAGQAVREDRYAEFNDTAISSPINCGRNTGTRKVACRVWGNGISFSTLKTALAKVGAPVDNLTIRIETNSAGAPSGTLADANASATIAGGTLTTSDAEYTVTFGGAFTLTDKTQYWLVFYRDGSLSDVNHYVIGNGQSYEGSATSSGLGHWTTSDLSSTYTQGGIVLEIQSCAGIYSVLAGLTGTAVGGESLNNMFTFIGFALFSASVGTMVNVTLSGVDTNQSGLTPGKVYFLSDTAGAITATAPANVVPVGTAANSTTITINTGGRVRSGNTATANVRVFTGFYPRFVSTAKGTYSQSELYGETLVSNKTGLGFSINTGAATTYWVAYE